MTNKLIEIIGSVAKIIYYNKENGYTIADFKLNAYDLSSENVMLEEFKQA